jgi:cell division protein FtsZ
MVKEYSTSGVKIGIVGVGGGGCNTIKRLLEYGMKGPELVAINTDRIHLDTIKSPAKKILIGQSITKGLGAGGYPEIAQKSAEASKPEIESILSDFDLIFLVAGMGGGTGTGAAPVVAEIAKKNGALVVSIVTYPFRIERARLEKAKKGIEELRKVSDTIVVIDNQKLLDFVPNLPIEQSFMIADEITARAVRGITETLLHPSLINLDFADLTTIMTGGGFAMIAVGEGKGIDRVEEVVKTTLDNRLLDVDPKGAKGVLLHITGGPDLTLGDANTVGEKITAEVDPYANVIYGARMDQSYLGRIEVIAIMTGLKEGEALRAMGIQEKKKEEKSYGDLWY